MALFFISYRAATASAHAGRLYDRLVAHFGEAAIFYDRGRLNPGESWRDRLRQELEQAAAALALIDPTWESSFESRAEEEDVVRFELETALALSKAVVPILVGRSILPKRSDLAPSLQPLLDRQFVVLEETTAASYTDAVARLIRQLAERDDVLSISEREILLRLEEKDYAGAERRLLRLPEATREAATFSVYLALARLGGRSFNALYPVEREAIEALLRRARKASPHWLLPTVLLAILEIDFYQLHGLVSSAPVRATDLAVESSTPKLDASARQLLSHLNVSRRARRELRLDALLSGVVHD